jgi:hypothetical protein
MTSVLGAKSGPGYDRHETHEPLHFCRLPSRLEETDRCCPSRLQTAFDLHSAWPEMELKVVPNAGHSMYEPGITHEIIEATDKYRRLEQ